MCICHSTTATYLHRACVCHSTRTAMHVISAMICCGKIECNIITLSTSYIYTYICTCAPYPSPRGAYTCICTVYLHYASISSFAFVTSLGCLSIISLDSGRLFALYSYFGIAWLHEARHGSCPDQCVCNVLALSSCVHMQAPAPPLLAQTHE